MNKKAAIDKIRLLVEISKPSNEHLILDNTAEMDKMRVRRILAEMRIFSSALMDYANAALSKKML